MIVGGEPELALLLHLFPEGVEELDGAYAVYADEPPIGFDVIAVDDVQDGWEDAWREFHHGVVIGNLWVGPPWEAAPAGATPVTIDALFGLVMLGSAEWTSRKKPEFIRELRNGATPATIARSMYSNGEPSRQTTTRGLEGQP